MTTIREQLAIDQAAAAHWSAARTADQAAGQHTPWIRHAHESAATLAEATWQQFRAAGERPLTRTEREAGESALAARYSLSEEG